MRSAFLAVAAFALTSACQPVSTGGSGQTSDGEPVAGSLAADAMQTEFTATISSPSGWNCSGVVGRPDSPTAIRHIPLRCNNGLTGTLLLTGNQFQQQIVGSFQLSDGRSGQVTFGQT